MNKQETRIDKLEKEIQSDQIVQFIGWKNRPWTEEEQAEAIKAHPDCIFFWRSLSDNRDS